MEIKMPDLQPLLPVLGTLGLILIVLEGALELELTKEKLPLIKNSLRMAVWGMVIFCLGFGVTIYSIEDVSFKTALINAIPLGVVCSAITIPSAKLLNESDKEFVTYESSLSDILGVILFNFFVLEKHLGVHSLGFFLLKMLLIILFSATIIFLLFHFLSRIIHSVKFLPVIITLILLYAIFKLYHLPALILILLFGIFFANIEKLQEKKFFHKVEMISLKIEIRKLRRLTNETAFVIRTLFFLLFGFLIDINELLNPELFVWSVGIIAFIYIVRLILLKTLRIPLFPLLFVAPRGLIALLLFLAIPSTHASLIVNESLIIQVVILSSLIMMLGVIPNKRK